MKTDWVEFSGLLMALLLAWLLGSLGGYGYGIKAVRTQAIGAGCAQWTVDRSTGEVHFSWLPRAAK